MKKGVCIALTGGIACGKSTVAAFWQRWGAQVADADVLAHELIAPHGACVDAVLKEFGAQMQAADGGVDRAKLAAVVFADAAARQRLEALLHPEVIRRMRAWVEEVRRDGLCGVGVVPLLFEAVSYTHLDVYKRQVPGVPEWEEIPAPMPDLDKMKSFFETYELRQFAAELAEEQQAPSVSRSPRPPKPAPKPADDGQMSLF